MAKINEIFDTIKSYEESVKILKDELIKTIEEIGENENLEGMGKGKVFSMNYSDLNNSWSPEDYNLDFQKKTIVEICENTQNLETLKTKLEDIVEKGRYRIDRGDTLIFHPSFLEKLKELLYD